MTGNRIHWGRTSSMGPDHARWPDTYPAQPEASHAAPELDDDQDRDGLGFFRGMRVAFIAAVGLVGACLFIAWGIWSNW